MSALGVEPQLARCPRCGNAFHCGSQDPAPCPCMGFTLSAATAQMLREQYRSCVCMACMAQLHMASTAADIKKPAQS